MKTPKRLWFDSWWITQKKYTIEDLKFTLDYYEEIQNRKEDDWSMSYRDRTYRINYLKKLIEQWKKKQ